MIQQLFYNLYFISLLPAFLALTLAFLPTARALELNAIAAEGEPVWEAGIFGGAILLPHYRGSKYYDFYAVPFPFFIYRGEVFEMDREGARGIFFKRSWGEVDFSFQGNPPVKDDDAREGMPDLNPLVEAGPAFRLYFQNDEPGTKLYLLAALRGVVSVDTKDFRPSYTGLRGGLSLVLSDFKFRDESPWKFGGNIGIDFADNRYNSYFYDVTEEQVIPGRNAYSSSGGYGGAWLSAFASRKLSRSLEWGLFLRWDNINGAVYERSPMAREKDNILAGTALIWTFAESERRRANR